MTRLLLPFVSVLFLSAIHAPLYADQAKCKTSFESELFDQALMACRDASVAGEPMGKFYLGMMYLRGFGVEKNEQIASRLIQESAQLGNIDALSKMGAIYQSGELVTKNQRKACDWWARLADLGNAHGQERLGVCYLMGRGREKNMKLGYAYLSLAAQNGDSAAKYIIDTYGDRFPPSAKKEAIQLAKQISGN